MKKIIVITGPTGVGKTKISIELAKYFNAEIINADSMQVYKYLNIGTAKITEEEKSNVTHHLLDIINPNEKYSIYDYQKDTREIINNTDQQLFLVGGSGLYIKAALYDYELHDEEEYDLSGLTNEQLYQYIITQDTNNKTHLNNRPRLEREYIKLKNNYGVKPATILYPHIVIGLTKERELLYENINNRVDKMFGLGLEKEVKNLLNNNIIDPNIITGIGYKELYPYFDNKISIDDAKESIKLNTRRYAKRQVTFLKHQLNTKWFDVDDEELINKIINYIKKELE